MSRLRGEDTVQVAIVKMVEGNPGALAVCTHLLEQGTRIDPQAFVGGLFAILAMDTLGIYGPRIWGLYKRVCKENLVNLCAVLRAWQLGRLPADDIQHAIDEGGFELRLDQVLEAVRGELTKFTREAS